MLIIRINEDIEKRKDPAIYGDYKVVNVRITVSIVVSVDQAH